MKKTISTLVVFAIIVLLASTMVSAVTSKTLVDDLYAMGKKYGVTSADKVKLERILADYPVTDAQAEQIYAKATEALKLAEEAGVTHAKKLGTELSKEQQASMRKIAQEAADIMGLQLTYKNGTVEVYKDGKFIEVFTFTDKLSYTGNEVNMALVISSIAVVALATGFVVKKKFANA